MFTTNKARVKNQLNKKIKRVRSNRNGEYFLLNEFCEKEIIIHEVIHLNLMEYRKGKIES